MLGQAAAMLIPFPAAFAAKFGHGTLAFAFDKGRTFAGPTVTVLSSRSRTGGRRSGRCSIRSRGWTSSIGGGREVGRDRRRVMVDTGTVHTPGEIRRGSETGRGPNGAGFHERFTPTSSTTGRHGDGSGFTAGILDGGCDRSSHGIGSSGGGDTLTTSDAMVGIYSAERNGVGMVSRVVGMGERT